MYKIQFNNLCAPLFLNTKDEVEAAVRLYKYLWGERRVLPAKVKDLYKKEGRNYKYLRVFPIDIPPHFVHPKREADTVHEMPREYNTISEGITGALFSHMDHSEAKYIYDHEHELVRLFGGEPDREYIRRHNERQAKMRAFYLENHMPERAEDYKDIPLDF